MIVHHHPPFPQMTVPDHPELVSGMRRAIIRPAGLGVEEFIRLLGR